jgi:hypothetical protein
MGRILRLLETTDIMSQAEASNLFAAADVGTTELRAALAPLTQYSANRRKRLFRAVVQIRTMSSSSRSSSSSSSSSKLS